MHSLLSQVFSTRLNISKHLIFFLFFARKIRTLVVLIEQNRIFFSIIVGIALLMVRNACSESPCISLGLLSECHSVGWCGLHQMEIPPNILKFSIARLN